MSSRRPFVLFVATAIVIAAIATGVATVSKAVTTAPRAVAPAAMDTGAKLHIHRFRILAKRISIRSHPSGKKAIVRMRAVVKIKSSTAGKLRYELRRKQSAKGRGSPRRLQELAVRKAKKAIRKSALKRALRVHSRTSPARPTPDPASAPTPSGTALGLNVWDKQSLTGAQARLGWEGAIVGIFADWGHNPEFPIDMASHARDLGATLLVAWEPWDSWNPDVDQGNFQLEDILAGHYDALITRWAQEVRAFGDPVLIRWAPEMNGDWRPWSPGVNGNSAEQYVEAWRHVVAAFAEQGVENVRWVWNPIVDSGGVVPMSEVFPGSEYVDFLALDGYNWGSIRPWGWQSYDDIFASSVALLGEISPGTPWFIAETGSAPGDRKAAWVSEVLRSAHRDGAIAVVWFEFNKETDWRLSADSESVAAVHDFAIAPDWFTAGDLTPEFWAR